MSASGVPPLLWKAIHVRFALHFLSYSDDDVPWDTNKSPGVSPHGFAMWLNSYLELILAGLCVVCCVVLFGYYCYEHYRLQAQDRHSASRRKFWTVDKINACLIPIALAVAFVALYFMSR